MLINLIILFSITCGYFYLCWIAYSLQIKVNIIWEGNKILWILLQIMLCGGILTLILGWPLPMVLFAETIWEISADIKAIFVFFIMFSGMALAFLGSKYHS